jgi:hypothetical protein
MVKMATGRAPNLALWAILVLSLLVALGAVEPLDHSQSLGAHAPGLKG